MIESCREVFTKIIFKFLVVKSFLTYSNVKFSQKILFIFLSCSLFCFPFFFNSLHFFSLSHLDQVSRRGHSSGLLQVLCDFVLGDRVRCIDLV